MTVSTAWDGSTSRSFTLLLASRSFVVKVWDSAPVAAGEPVELAVWAFGDTGRGPNSWDPFADFLAGPPRWGRGEPPRPAIGGGSSRREKTAWRPPRRRVVAISGPAVGARDGVAADEVLAATADLGAPDVLLGHGTGAEAVMLAADRSMPTILLDGGTPVAADDTVALCNAWARRAPAFLVTALGSGGLYPLRALAPLLQQNPRTGWHGMANCDHASLPTHPETVRLLPALIWRAHTGRTTSDDGGPLRHRGVPAGPPMSVPPAPPTVPPRPRRPFD